MLICVHYSGNQTQRGIVESIIFICFYIFIFLSHELCGKRGVFSLRVFQVRITLCGQDNLHRIRVPSDKNLQSPVKN